MENKPEHGDIFTHFMEEIYVNFLNDYIHFVRNHSNQIEEIHLHFTNNRGFAKCDIKECTLTSRHHEVDDNNAKNKSVDLKFEFYKYRNNG